MHLLRFILQVQKNDYRTKHETAKIQEKQNQKKVQLYKPSSNFRKIRNELNNPKGPENITK